jgi:hypothetical protein
MAVASFEDLCAGYCEILGVRTPELAPDDEGRVAFHVVLRGVTVNMVHSAQTSPDHLFVLIELGPVNEAGDLQALLNANFVLDLDPPTLSRNPATGDAVLQFSYALFEATPNDLREMIEHGVEWAANWREHLVTPGRAPDDRSDTASTPFSMFNLA